MCSCSQGVSSCLTLQCMPTCQDGVRRRAVAAPAAAAAVVIAEERGLWSRGIRRRRGLLRRLQRAARVAAQGRCSHKARAPAAGEPGLLLLLRARLIDAWHSNDRQLCSRPPSPAPGPLVSERSRRGRGSTGLFGHCRGPAAAPPPAGERRHAWRYTAACSCPATPYTRTPQGAVASVAAQAVSLNVAKDVVAWTSQPLAAPPRGLPADDTKTCHPLASGVANAPELQLQPATRARSTSCELRELPAISLECSTQDMLYGLNDGGSRGTLPA